MDSLRVAHSIVKTNASQNVAPLGIGTIFAFKKYLIVNNLDQNIEVSTIEKKLLKPMAIYTDSIYPEDSEDAAFDLDAHTFLYSEALKSILFINHFGRITFFDSNALQSNQGHLKVQTQVKWLGDVEQTLLIGDCLVSTSPGGYHVPEPAQPGLFVSEPLLFSNKKLFSQSVNQPEKLEYSIYFANKGAATAIGKSNNLLAVAFGQEIILFKIDKENEFLSANSIVQEVKVNFHTRFLSFSGENFLVCAGHDVNCKKDTTDSTSLTGGGLAIMDISNGQIITSVPFKENLAWGNGGQCLTVAQHLNGGMQIIGVDRQANLYRWHGKNASPQILIQPFKQENSSFGISHLVWQGANLFCGFNRDGNRLHKYTFSM